MKVFPCWAAANILQELVMNRQMVFLQARSDPGLLTLSLSFMHSFYQLKCWFNGVYDGSGWQVNPVLRTQFCFNQTETVIQLNRVKHTEYRIKAVCDGAHGLICSPGFPGFSAGQFYLHCLLWLLLIILLIL